MKYSIFAAALILISIPSFGQGEVIITNSTRNDTSAPIGEQRKAATVKSESSNLSDINSTARQISQNNIEQTQNGFREPATLVTSFEGLGYGFGGPQGSSKPRNPSDNSLAVGPDHIVQTVNSQMAIFTKKGSKFDETGKVLYGPVDTRNVFTGFGGPCDRINNGDAVVRYDQLADRWLIVMPIFRKVPKHENEPAAGKSGEPARLSMPGIQGQPGKAELLVPPVKLSPAEQAVADSFAGPIVSLRRRTGRIVCAMLSAPAPIRSVLTTDTNLYVHCFPIIRGLQCGPMAITYQPVPVTILFRSMHVWLNGVRC